MGHFLFLCYEIWNRGELYVLLYVYLREVYGFKFVWCTRIMNVYILLLVLESSTNQQSQHVHFAKLYKIALIVKSSDHNIALTHQEVLPCEKHSLDFSNTGRSSQNARLGETGVSLKWDIQLTNSNKHQAKKKMYTHLHTHTHTYTFTHIYFICIYINSWLLLFDMSFHYCPAACQNNDRVRHNSQSNADSLWIWDVMKSL